MNLGKYKLILQQSWGIISVPVAIATNLGVMFGLFSLELAIAALVVTFGLFLSIAWVVAHITIGQEYNYAWEKTPAFTNFRSETLTRLERIEALVSKER